MLGYKGRSDRREFAAGVALAVVAPMALWMVIPGTIPRLFAAFPKLVALGLAVMLSLLVCASIIAWFWGGTALLTRRARDIGLPAWTGVVSVIALAASSEALERAAPSNWENAIGWLTMIAFVGAWMVWPGRGEPRRLRLAPHSPSVETA
ncbi:hypothetical protein BH09PSE1_BH09PSE1_25990 [soil metagenome]